jgi:CRP-like cAMP-binding protein
MSKNIKILDRQFFPAGSVIMEQGTMGSRAFMVESGSVEVFVKDAGGNETLLSEMGPGAMVGEMAALSDDVRSASVRTKEDSVLVTIPAHDLHSSMKASDALYKRLIRMMSVRMKETNMRLLQKEQQLAETEKAASESIQNIASYLSQKQDKMRNELAPLLSHIRASWEQFQPSDFARKD